MSWRPQLNAVCGRCGKPRGLIHECVSNSTRSQSVKPKLSFGNCPKCHKPYGGNPLGHTCAPSSDFKSRKRKHEKQQRDAARKKKRKDTHDYTSCSDNDCPRSLCVAYKKGFKQGDEEGYKRGWETCYPVAFEDGIAHCPRLHK
jgi:hypothetical protein